MSVHLHDKKISYFSIPKCACTAVKHMFFEIENGFKYRPFSMNGIAHTFQRGYMSKPFKVNVENAPQGAWKVAVVRDPVDRMVSLWSDKVRVGKVLDEGMIELSAEDLAKGLTYRPDVDRFARFSDRYHAISRHVRKHSHQYLFHLGTDPAYFDKLYNIKDLDQLAADLADRVETVPVIAKMNRRKGSATTDDLSPQAVAAVRQVYARDIEIFKKWL